MRIKWRDTIGTYVNNFYINDIKYDKNKQAIVYVTCPVCGQKKWINTSSIKKQQKGCGCLLKKTKDIKGQKFGKLTAIKMTGAKNKRGYEWLCKCDCGGEIIASAAELIEGRIKSCGCLYSAKKMQEINKQNYLVNGTLVPMIKNNKIYKNNKSGVRGVIFDKTYNKWHAYIHFQKKRYKLGHYTDKQDAINARKKAEEKLYGNFLQWYAETYPEKWEKLNKNKD